MKNLIFQYWNDLPMPPGAIAGTCAMKAYAEHIGAEYRLDVNQYWSKQTGQNVKVWERVRPIFDDAFLAYDRVVYADLDIFPREGVTASIFDEPLGDFGMCMEPMQPEFRERAIKQGKNINGNNDRAWAALMHDKFGVVVSCDAKGRPLVFNAGLFMFSTEGLERARKHFIPINDFVSAVRVAGLPQFYSSDQGWLHANAFRLGINFTVLSPEWNRQIHGLHGGGTYDGRTEATRFVHVQLSGADHHDAAWHWKVVNEQGCYR